MRTDIVILILFGVVMYGRETLANPCISSSFDVPLPGAVDVIVSYADVPSPLFPGVWQEGVINGLPYAIYSNGEGYLKPSLSSEDWHMSFSCGRDSCTTTLVGSPPKEAVEQLEELTSCVLGKAPARKDISGRKSIASYESINEPIEEASTEDQENCPLNDDRRDVDGFQLQRLLVEAGSDPGPIDGTVGKLTRKALIEVLGSSAAEMNLGQAINALRKINCISDFQ
jgi:hypothetical protein